MFHSRGIVQSNARVPDATSVRSSAICRSTISSDLRTPLPVMLRQMGKSSVASAYMRSPTSTSHRRIMRSAQHFFVQLAQRSGSCSAAGIRSGRSTVDVPQRAIEDSIGDQLLDMTNALVARPFELLERNVGRLVGGIELF